LLIGGSVYDVTKYKDHPGGFDTLVNNSGKDSTKAFADVKHSPEAIKELEQYKIGTLYVSALFQKVEMMKPILSVFLAKSALIAHAITEIL